MIALNLRKAIKCCYVQMPEWQAVVGGKIHIKPLLDKVTLQVEEAIFDLDQEDEQDKKFIVKCILDFAIFKEDCRRYPMYLVEWEGFPKPTWEYDYNLNHCDEIDIFWMRVEYRQSSQVKGVFKFF